MRKLDKTFMLNGFKYLFEIFQKIVFFIPIKFFNLCGYYVFKKHYYLPIPDKTDMSFAVDTELKGVDINDDICFSYIENVFNIYKMEFNSFSQTKNDSNQYYLLNGNYMAIDGNVYYSLIRHLNPKKVIEIGSGNSTKLALAAIRKSEIDNNSNTELLCIEPFRADMLRQNFNNEISIIEKRVQEVELSVFEKLEKNDILFIDSSHALKSGGDVWYEFCEILPRLKSGVYVHIHDISLPKPYPNVYFENNLFWNEQYILQAFLTFNSKFEVIWAGNYMITKYPDKISKAFSPEYQLMRSKFPSSEPSSFWIKVK